MNNTTQYHVLMSLPEVIAWCTAYVTVDLLIVIGNSLTLAVFYTNKRLLRMRANYFLINLAVADLLVGIIAVPFFTYYLALSSQYGPLVWGRFPYLVAKVLDIFIGCASILTLTIIAIERVFSVCYPHIHRGMGQKAYYYMIGGVWMLCLLMMILRSLALTQLIKFQVFFYFLIVTFIASLIIICISYPVIGIRMKFRFANVDHHRKTNDHDRRLALMLFIVTTFFIFTWLPFHVLNFVSFLCKSCRMIPYEVVYIIKLLHYINSCVNPIIYSYLVPEFKRTVFKIFARKHGQRRRFDTTVSRA